jgi:hypothetical protein
MESFYQTKLNEVIDDDSKKINELNDISIDIEKRKLGELQDHHQKIKTKILQLQEEKQELYRAPFTKEELLKIAKEELRKKRSEWGINRGLVLHLKSCQAAGVFPFDQVALRTSVFPESQAWKLAYFCITEKDIEEAIALLPDIGVSLEEREEKIKKIDKEISRLSGLLEKEFKEVNKAISQVHTDFKNEIENK